MKILCKSCTHSCVCKYKYDYERSVENFDQKGNYTPFNIKLECPYYNPENCYRLNSTNVLTNGLTTVLTDNNATNGIMDTKDLITRCLNED